MIDAASLSTLTRSQREGFIDTLEGLTPEQWLAPSLCSEWRVHRRRRTPGLGSGAGRGRRGRGHGPARLLDEPDDRPVRHRLVGARPGCDPASSSGTTRAAAPVRSACRPWPRSRTPWCTGSTYAARSGSRVRCRWSRWGRLADFTLGTPWPMNVVVGGSARRRVAGVRLVATDTDWSHGEGPDVRGTRRGAASAPLRARPEGGRAGRSRRRHGAGPPLTCSPTVAVVKTAWPTTRHTAQADAGQLTGSAEISAQGQGAWLGSGPVWTRGGGTIPAALGWPRSGVDLAGEPGAQRRSTRRCRHRPSRCSRTTCR